MAIYKLTKQGRETCKKYIIELKAKRKEIFDARLDTVGETEIPTVEDILADINYGVGVDNGSYYNNWSVTDNYDGDYPLGLEFGRDLVVVE